MIMLTALLDILHRRYGRPCRVIGAGAWAAEIYRSHPDVAEVICLGRHTAFFLDREWWRARRALHADSAAPVYVCEDFPRKLPRIARLLRWSGTPANRCVFMTDVLAAAKRQGQAPEHWVDRLIALGRHTPPAFAEADYPWPEPPPRCAPLLEITPTERSECEAWLASQGWLGRPLVLVQPGNQRMMKGRPHALPEDHKAWPVERWTELLRHVQQHLQTRLPRALIVIVGAPQEAPFLEVIRAQARLPAVNLALLPLRRLFALCARSHSMISIDTGPAHAAAAVGLPLVVLFGASPPQMWQPRSALGSPVVAVGGAPVSSRVDEIPEHAVFEAWCGLLERLQSAPVPSDHAAS